jgi:hypothetical protein
MRRIDILNISVVRIINNITRLPAGIVVMHPMKNARAFVRAERNEIHCYF